eukprot:COSAG03_NODE_5842_length_1164_cov_1.361502_2_plen_49_part_01
MLPRGVLAPGEECEKSRASKIRSLNKVVGTRRLIQRIGRVSSCVGGALR